MKFLDLILQREPVTSPLILQAMGKSNIKSKYLKNIVEEIKENNSAIPFIESILNKDEIDKLDSQSIKILNMLTPQFCNQINLLTNNAAYSVYKNTYKFYFEFLGGDIELIKDNFQNIQENFFAIQYFYNQKDWSNEDKDSLFSLPLWDVLLSNLHFSDISKKLELNFNNQLSLNSIRQLTKSIARTNNFPLKNSFYQYLFQHEFVMYFGTILNKTPEIMFDINFISELLKNDKSRHFNICEFFTLLDPSSHKKYRSGNEIENFIEINQDSIRNVFKYIFEQYKNINENNDTQNRIFIDKHIKDISEFINNNPGNILTAHIIEAATLSYPEYLKKVKILSPLFLPFVKQDLYDLKTKQKYILINKELQLFNPFVLNYLIHFFDKNISYDLQLNIVKNILTDHFKDLEYKDYKSLYDDFIIKYKELSDPDFKLRVYILDDVEKTIDNFNANITEKKHFSHEQHEINLNYDNFKERLIFLSDNIINLIDSINLYGLKYDSYLHKISETDSESYSNYDEGLHWALNKISQSDLKKISFESVKNFFLINFFNFKSEDIPELANIFSQYKDEDILLEDDVKNKIDSPYTPFNLENIETLRSLIQKNILFENIEFETIDNNKIIHKRRL